MADHEYWSGGRVKTARAALAALLPAPCWRCGRMVTEDMDWHVGHIIDRADAPELTNDPSNWAPEHAWCNTSAGGRKASARRQARPRATTSRDW